MTKFAFVCPVCRSPANITRVISDERDTVFVGTCSFCENEVRISVLKELIEQVRKLLGP